MKLVFACGCVHELFFWYKYACRIFLNHPTLSLQNEMVHALPSLILLASASELNPANTTLQWKNKITIKNIFKKNKGVHSKNNLQTALLSDHLSSATSFPKYQTFPCQITLFGASCKQPIVKKFTMPFCGCCQNRILYAIARDR